MATQAPNSYKDPFWSDLASSTEQKLGLPSGLLKSVLLYGESSNADQVSDANAKTPFQLIPATRTAVLDKYGVDAYLSPQNAAEAAGLLLKESLQRNKGDIKLKKPTEKQKDLTFTLMEMPGGKPLPGDKK